MGGDLWEDDVGLGAFDEQDGFGREREREEGGGGGAG